MDSCRLGTGRTLPLKSDPAMTSGDRVVVMACDEPYAMPLATTLRSMVESNQTSRCLDIVVVTSQFSDEMKQKVLRSVPDGCVSIRWTTIDLKMFEKFSTRPCISKMTYARLLVPHLIPGHVSRVLYLDADMLVLNDLQMLWEVDLQGAALGAVADIDSQIHTKRLGLRQRLPGDLKDDASLRPGYFNAGFLLIDVSRWRNQKISERALEYMVQNPNAPLADQDALNVACNGQWRPLDPSWNYQKHYNIRLSEMSPEWRPRIVHFVMDIKPWDPSARSVNAAFYDDFRSRTCFARTTREKVRDMVKANLSPLKRAAKRHFLLRAARDRNVHQPEI